MGQCKFRRADRLTRKPDFDFVFGNGKRLRGRYFICYIAQDDQRESRLGLAVSRKVGKAVVRNRVKRYIREFFRTHRGRFLREVQLVVVARPESAGLSYEESACAIGRLLQQGGVLDG